MAESVIPERDLERDRLYRDAIESCEILLRLAETVDVFVENFKKETLEIER